jgi:hypothetical protein
MLRPIPNRVQQISLFSLSRSEFRLLEIVWKRAMNPLLYYDSIYSLTSMKKQEDSYRQFIFEFISNEWNNLLMDTSSTVNENSFIYQLMRVSDNGRKYTRDEINDHVGTMLVAVSLLTFSLLSCFPKSDSCFPLISIFNYVLTMWRLEIRQALLWISFS